MFFSYLSKALINFSLISMMFSFSISNGSAEPLNILVSIKPLHSLISHITQDLNTTNLLLTQQQSAHHFQLRPSQKRLINKADIFFYSSNNLESFANSLKNTHEQTKYIQLSHIPEINSLATRSFHAHNHPDTDALDGHIWLSIENAKVISKYISTVLSEASPELEFQYKKNLKLLLSKLDTLKQDNLALLKPFKNTNYLVYHDAFQYFELENGLLGASFITTNPEHSPGIKRIKELRNLIKTKNIQCVFYEPPNIPALLNTITEGQAVTLSPIDPSGLYLPEGKQHYFQLLQQTATTLSNCFKVK